MLISWIGRMGTSDFRNARAGFAFSTTKCESARATSIVRAGSTCSGGTAPSRFGTRYSRPLAAIASARHAHARVAQHRSEPDQRQTDERGRVIAFDAFEQCDAERLRLDRSRAVVRPLAAQIRFDLVGGELAERAAHVDQRQPAVAGRGVEQRDAGMEDDRAARQPRQLRNGAFVITGLSNRLAGAIGDLGGGGVIDFCIVFTDIFHTNRERRYYATFGLASARQRSMRAIMDGRGSQ